MMRLFDYERKHLEMLRKELAGCTVLLKTDGSFPLPKPGPIALYGSGARHTVKGCSARPFIWGSTWQTHSGSPTPG